MICPHCGKAIRLETDTGHTYPSPYFNEDSSGYRIISGCCPACENLIVILQFGECSVEKSGGYSYYDLEDVDKQQIIYPINYIRTVQTEVPEIYKTDFLEACAVLPISTKASAALSRRLLQMILREYFGVKHSDLSREIDEFIQTKNAPSYLNDAIDAVRNIGNFAAHPLKSTSTGEIVDVEPGEAEWLIEVIEFLFDFAFVQPKKLEDRRAKLNEKLKDLGKPPMKKK